MPFATGHPLLGLIWSSPRRVLTNRHQNADGSTPDEEDARTNLESFLAAHIVPEKMDLPGGPAHTLLKGVDVTVEGEEGAYVVQPGNVKVLGVKEASNGRILYIDGIVPFQK